MSSVRMLEIQRSRLPFLPLLPSQKTGARCGPHQLLRKNRRYLFSENLEPRCKKKEEIDSESFNRTARTTCDISFFLSEFFEIPQTNIKSISLKFDVFSLFLFSTTVGIPKLSCTPFKLHHGRPSPKHQTGSICLRQRKRNLWEIAAKCLWQKWIYEY